MNINELRDLIIVIAGLLVIAVLALLAVVLLSIYRRIKSVLDSIKTIVGGIRDISQAHVVDRVREGIDMVNKIFGTQEGGKT